MQHRRSREQESHRCFDGTALLPAAADTSFALHKTSLHRNISPHLYNGVQARGFVAHGRLGRLDAAERRLGAAVVPPPQLPPLLLLLRLGALFRRQRQHISMSEMCTVAKTAWSGLHVPFGRNPFAWLALTCL